MKTNKSSTLVFSYVFFFVFVLAKVWRTQTEGSNVNKSLIVFFKSNAAIKPNAISSVASCYYCLFYMVTVSTIDLQLKNKVARQKSVCVLAS